jgi:hypothetical protein
VNQGLDEVLRDFQLRVFGEEMTRVNALPVGQRRAYVRYLWESCVQRADTEALTLRQRTGEPRGPKALSQNQFFEGEARKRSSSM